MSQSVEWKRDVVYDVEQNADFAIRVLSEYLHPSPAQPGSAVVPPDFFLIKPGVLDGMDCTGQGDALRSLLACKAQAVAREGHIGVTTQSGDAGPRLRFAVYPCKPGDDASRSPLEFYTLLSRFILHTREHESVYGDLTAPGEADRNVGPLLHEICASAARFNARSKLYSDAMLLSYDAGWPAKEVGRLMSAYARFDTDGHGLFMEYLRHAMRNHAGVGRSWRAGPMSVGGDTQTHTVHASVKFGSKGLEDRIEMAKVRAAHLSEMAQETQRQALLAEENKVRIEALAVVAARKRLKDAEAAGVASLARLDGHAVGIAGAHSGLSGETPHIQSGASVSDSLESASQPRAHAAKLPYPNAEQPGPKGADKGAARRARKGRRKLLAHTLTAGACLLMGWIGGRYLLPAEPRPSVMLKVQPISHPAEVAAAHPAESGVLAPPTRNAPDVVEGQGTGVSLRMSDRLAL